MNGKKIRYINKREKAKKKRGNLLPDLMTKTYLWRCKIRTNKYIASVTTPRRL